MKPIIAARPLSFSAFSLNIIDTSEDAEEEFTSDSIGKETRNDSHHCPATIVGLCELLGRFKTLTVVGFYYHLRLASEDVLLPQLVSCYSHL